jgi:hypothetical protein
MPCSSNVVPETVIWWDLHFKAELVLAAAVVLMDKVFLK